MYMRVCLCEKQRRQAEALVLCNMSIQGTVDSFTAVNESTMVYMVLWFIVNSGLKDCRDNYAVAENVRVRSIKTAEEPDDYTKQNLPSQLLRDAISPQHVSHISHFKLVLPSSVISVSAAF